MVDYWCVFKEGSIVLDDALLSISPLTPTCNENIAGIDKLVRKDKRIKKRVMASLPQISKAVHVIHSWLETKGFIAVFQQTTLRW